MYVFPREIDPAKHDILLLDDGTKAHVTASYEMSPTVWVVEIPGQMVQLDPEQRVRIQRSV